MIPEILKHSDFSHTYIFHSSVAAQLFLQTLLKQGHKQIIRSDSFLSWTKFRKIELSKKIKRNPVDANTRMFFAQWIVEQEKELQKLSTPDVSTSTLVSFIYSLLINLLPIIRLRTFEYFPHKKILLLLYHHYKNFLEKYILFEVEWEDVSDLIYDKNITFMLPELIPSICIANIKEENISTFSINEFLSIHKETNNTFHHYKTGYEEIQNTLFQISQLLDQGISPNEIVITVAALPRYQNLLRASADFYGIPLQISTPVNATQHKNTRIFSLIASVLENEFNYESMQQLFFEPSIQWRNQTKLRQIAQIGKTYNCIQGLTSEKDDRWHHVLPQELLHIYKKFRTSVTAFTQQKSFQALSETIDQFIHEFLVKNTWIEEGRKTLASLILLQGHSSMSIQSPWHMLLKVLNKRFYSPSQAHNAVTVYPYPQTAGIPITHHFILNCSHQDTLVLHDPFPGIPTFYKNLLNVQPQYLTDTFLKVMFVSGNKIKCSMSTYNFGEIRFACLPLMDKDVPQKEFVDPYIQEPLFWKGASIPKSFRLSPMQAIALNHILHTGLASIVPENFRTTDLSLLPFPSKISVTTLDTYRHAPFSYYLRLLELQDLHPSYKTEYAKSIGTLVHRVLDTYLSKEVRSLSFNIIYKDIDSIMEQHKKPIELLSLVPRHTRHALVEIITTFLVIFLPIYHGMQVVKQEDPVIYTAQDVNITGKIDLLLSHEKENVLIDYKLSHQFSKSDFLNMEQLEVFPSLQLFFYTLCMQEEFPISEATYWYIRNLKSLSLFNFRSNQNSSKKLVVFSQKTIQRIITELPSLIEQLLSKLKEGDFRCPTAHAFCAQCQYKSICRGGFSTEQ